MEEKENNTIWIPHHEALLMKEMSDAMSPIQKMRMSYFFWNNFSDAGWDEAFAKFSIENEGKELIMLKKRNNGE